MTRWRLAALVLTVLGLVCVVIWSDRPGTPARAVEGSATLSPSSQASPVPTVSPQVRTPEDDPLVPVRLDVPAMRLSTKLITLGLQADRTVEVPGNPALAGWYRRGPTPGALGSAVILGHVDSVDGPAVFAGLSSLSPGDRVRVLMDDGSVATFAVHSVSTYANEAFPAHKVYGSHGRRELNLVTCGGAYDASLGGYQSNVVVNARWVTRR